MSDIDLADWCETSENITICGTRMVRWCFTHRKREEFFWVVMTPDGLSYFGPSAHMEGPKSDCRDLFPGWERECIDV